MIARVWHGYTKPEHADAYEAMLKPELLPGIGNVRAVTFINAPGRWTGIPRKTEIAAIGIMSTHFSRQNSQAAGGRKIPFMLK